MGLNPLIILYAVAIAAAQDRLAINRPVTRTIAPGATQSYTLSLDDGDYVHGEITQRGVTVSMEILLPSGALLRRFAGTPSPALHFSFVAEAAGTYRLDVKAGTASQPGEYELVATGRLALDERMKPAPPAEKYPSPRIEALRKQVAAGAKNIEAFWREAERDGTPLVEPFARSDKFQLVTFLWRGGSHTRNVLVAFFPFAASHTDDYLMRRLADTDVWYLTIRLPRGARFAYRLSPNDPLSFEKPRANQRNAQADPLNPRRWKCPTGGDKFECDSLAELPGAPAQPWIVKNAATPAGTLENHKIKSERLNNERTLTVYTTPGYSKDQPAYALLVLFDRSAYLDAVPTPVILDNLIAASKIPPIVAVLIGSPSQEARDRELPPNPDFAEFLARELVPWVRARYHVTSEPGKTVVAGSSYGGIAAAYAGFRHPELFGNVLSQSGSFWWAPGRSPEPDSDPAAETGYLAKEFIKSPKLPLRFYMDAGLFEVDLSGGGFGILVHSRHMRDVLLAKGYEVHYQQFVGGHDYLNWRGTLADGLIALVGLP